MSVVLLVRANSLGYPGASPSVAGAWFLPLVWGFARFPPGSGLGAEAFPGAEYFARKDARTDRALLNDISFWILGGLGSSMAGIVQAHILEFAAVIALPTCYGGFAFARRMCTAEVYVTPTEIILVLSRRVRAVLPWDQVRSIRGGGSDFLANLRVEVVPKEGAALRIQLHRDLGEEPFHRLTLRLGQIAYANQAIRQEEAPFSWHV